MCFGPIPSFGASMALGTIGAVTLKLSRSRTHLLLASFPVLFGIQQFSEGLLWLVIGKEQYTGLQSLFAFIFLFFALFAWPILVPLAWYGLEPLSRRKSFMLPCCVAGACLGVYFLFHLLAGNFTARVAGHCIQYETFVPGSIYLLDGVYVIAVVLSPLFSSIRPLLRLAVLNLALCLATFAAYSWAHTSVWCFFAALWSGLLYFYFKNNRPATNASIADL